MMRPTRRRNRILTLTAAAAAFMVVTVGTAAPALACGGVFSTNGEVNLTRTTTLAAYADGVEHYITAFEFAGAGGAFGSIVPLPGVPTTVEEGGEWTLQRLVKEVTPQRRNLESDAVFATAAGAPAEVLLETRVGALDLTVLRGGSQAVGEWATDNGFLLSPDAPEVLEFYAKRSQIFLAARFDAAAAADKGVNVGDGTPVHITIPTSNPWVPLRILGLGRVEGERIDADVFVLTEIKPTLLAGRDSAGVVLDRQEPASESLLADLRTDKGMDWLPQSMWLSYLKVAATPSELTYDLAIDASGAGKPSPEAAGLLGTDGGVDDGLLGTSRSGTGDDGGGTGRTIAFAGLGALVVLAVAGGIALAARRT